mmetsp:Transcript_22831/g.37573  ORF Transcript_22831/g.37573 Transcript_22831/m.37573 type:complete len:206 (+) Transcript_22831:706-1323(+)
MPMVTPRTRNVQGLERHTASLGNSKDSVESGGCGKTKGWSASRVEGTRTTLVRTPGPRKRCRSSDTRSMKSSSKVCSSGPPHLMTGCCTSMKGPIRIKTSGGEDRSESSKSAKGWYERFAVVVKGPAAATMVSGVEAASASLWLSSVSAVLSSKGSGAPCHNLEAISSLPRAFIPSTTTIWPGKSAKEGSSERLSLSRRPSDEVP